MWVKDYPLRYGYVNLLTNQFIGMNRIMSRRSLSWEEVISMEEDRDMGQIAKTEVNTGVLDDLKKKKAMVETQLGIINQAIEALENSPDTLHILELLNKVGPLRRY